MNEEQMIPGRPPKKGNESTVIQKNPVATTAFGEAVVAELTPVFQNDFSYGINDKIWDTHANNGTATDDSNRLKISTGAGANQSVAMLSRTPIKYRPGQGALARFTALFTTGVANSTQLAGVIDAGDGYAFGYNGADFGILRRVGGNIAVHKLIVTTKATSAGTVTIELNGVNKAIEVTDATSGDVTTTANDIAAGDYSNTGDGWEVHAEGDEVIFFSYNAEAKAGLFSFTDTDTTGAAVAAGVTTVLVGVAPTDNWTPQTAWNKDKMDGTGASGMTLDKTKGNIYQIQYQWLGFGQIKFYVEHDTDGALELVHTIDYANFNGTPSVYSPSLPICFMVGNASNTSNIVMHSGSASGFVEGKSSGGIINHGVGATVTNAGTAEIPILTIHNKRLFNGRINRNQIKLTFADISIDHTKNSTIKFKSNAVLTGASYADIDADSMVSSDSSATAVSGGDTQFVVGLTKDGSRNLPLGDIDFRLSPGDTLTVTEESSAVNGAITTTSFNWEEIL